MNEIFMPSLEHIALVKIAITLWNKTDIRASILRLPDTRSRDYRWSPIEKQVTLKVSMLPLPQHLKEKTLGLIKPIGEQISEWWKDYERVTCCLAENLPDEFYFTARGTLDRKKTNEALVKNEAIPFQQRYKIACTYCLQEDVKALWERMPRNRRQLFYSKKDPGRVRQGNLVVYWTYHILGEVAKMDYKIRWDNEKRCTPYQWAFHQALKEYNKVAVEYFLNKLNPEEREASLRYAMNTLQCVYGWDTDYTDTICFMLSQLDEAQQLQLLEMHPRQFLLGFLQWPRQCLFTIMTNHVEVFLEDLEYYQVLCTIIKKVEGGYKDYDYQKLFAEFWLRGNITSKKYVLNDCAKKKSANLLLRLLTIKDTKNASLIIKDATDEEKENIVRNAGSYFCFYLSKDRDTIQFFLSEFISSREGLVKFKDECERSNWNNSKKFFEWLDERIQKWNEKRRDEVKNCSSTKKFCSLASFENNKSNH